MRRPWPQFSKPIRSICCIIALSPIVFSLSVTWYGNFRSGQYRGCITMERHAAWALNMYANDYDDCLPPAAAWMDATLPYTTDRGEFRCPSAVRANPANYGYAFNSLLAFKHFSQRDDAATTPMVFESNQLGRNANAPNLKTLANPPRHWNRDNIVYADGHLQYIKLTISNPPDTGSKTGNNP